MLFSVNMKSRAPYEDRKSQAIGQESLRTLVKSAYSLGRNPKLISLR